jgi:uncharacterized protein (PEP-CTERM system associated)
MRYGFGSWALFQAQYRAERVDYGGELDASSQQIVNTSLANGPRFNRVGWELAYQRREERRSGGLGASSRQILQRGRGEINVRVGAQTQVFAAAGYEDNEYPQARGEDPPEGEFWEAGFRWRPTRHTSLEGAYGERFFGRTWNAAFTYKGPGTTWELGYSENLVTQTQLQFERSRVLVRDDEGNLVLTPEGDPLVVEIPVSSVRNEVFLQRRATGRVGWRSGLTSVVLSGFAEEREFQTQDLGEESYGGSLRLDYQVAARINFSMSGRAQHRTFATTDREDLWWSGRAQVQRTVSPSLKVSASYNYVVQDSEHSGQTYSAQEATLALSKTF